MKKRKGKTKRWLAGILSAVLVIGSINIVDALEGSNGESALYDAPELTITQGATDYDLMKDITYDSSMYELAVVNDGGFDVNTVGDYEVTYSLTSKDDGTLEPGDSGDASNSDNENKDQNSGDNQGGDNTQTGDNSDNAGSDNGSDSSDSSNGGDSADAGQGDTGSDSSNAEDSMDAGQGDTNSDSSNAGDSTDAGQGDTNSDSSNAEDTADAVSGEDAAQSEENTGDTGVLGVSRPRTGVDMSYQSEPVGAEAVDVTKGDDTNTVDTQEKQVITFTRTVHVVAASEDKEPVYVARELVLTQGEEDYDLTDEIVYDDVKYTLDVVELGGFDINKIGSYEVTYSLTPVTTEGTQENGQDDTQENQVITFQRTVTVEETGEFEVPELYLEQGQEDYDLAAGLVYDENKYKLNIKDDGNFDIMLSGEYKVTFVLNPLEENPDSENNTGDADTSDPDQTDGDQSEKVLGATRSMDSSAENADDKTENKNTEDNNTEDNNTESGNVEDKKEENDNTDNTDQTEDIFVIPDGITTFTRKVIVSPSLVRSAGLLDDLDTWPDESLLTEDVIEINFKVGVPIKPGKTINVRSGQTITVSNGTLSGGTNTLFNVQDGGHLTLDNVTITGNTADNQGAVCVQNGALLDLGYNDKNPSTTPQISGNTQNGEARNLVVADGARVRLNAKPLQPIGISHTADMNTSAPKEVMQGGRYAIEGEQDSNTNNETVITADRSDCVISYAYDKLILNLSKKQVLIWDPVSYCHDNSSGAPGILWENTATSFRSAGAEVQEYRGTNKSNPMTLVATGETEESVGKYDLIYIRAPYIDLTEGDKAILLNYLSHGGRVFIQAEDSHPYWIESNGAKNSFTEMNAKASELAVALGAQFTVNQSLAMALQEAGRDCRVLFGTAQTTTGTGLTAGMNTWSLAAASPIDVPSGATDVVVLMSTQTYHWVGTPGFATLPQEQGIKPWCVDQAAGNLNGVKWGRLTVSTDANMWAVSTMQGSQLENARIFAGNLLSDSCKNRISAAAGVNPNATTSNAQARINTTEYQTVTEALEKVREDEIVELLADSGLTPASNELLYNTSSIKEMNGNTVHADSNGTNVDVSDTGAVTLRSGVVTVSNTDANPRKLTVDGYVLTSTTDYTVKAVDTNNNTTLGDSQASVTLKATGDTFTAVKNGAAYTYTATRDNQTFYLGEYSAVLNWDERSGVAALASIGSPEFPAELVKPQTQPANPYHQLTPYTVTIKPREDYSIDVDKVWVSMGVDAQGDPQMLDASEFKKSKDPDTGIITVTVKKPVDGDLIYYVGKVNGGSSSGSTVTHDRTTIRVTSAAGSAVTTPEFTATYFDEQKSKDVTVNSQNGKVEVFKNVQVTLKFPAMNPSDPNPTEADLGITEDETFDILTKLAETGSTTDLKAGFDWTDKSYTYKFTSTSASYNLEASYGKSHVVHIHVSGGSMDTSTIPAGLKANTQSASNIRIIVPDQMTLKNLKFSPDRSLQNPSFTAKWLSHDNKTDLGTVNFSEGAGSWKGSTLAVTQPSYLNVSFVAGNMLTVRIKGGTLDTAYGNPVRNWTTKAAATDGFDHEYQLVVPVDDNTVHFKINVEGRRLLKSILANTKDVTPMAEAVKGADGRITAYTNGAAGSTIGEATTIDVTLVPSYTVTFWNKEVSPAKKLGTKVVMEGGKLDKAAYAEMSAAATLPGYQFMAWKDTAGKVYTDQTVISAATELHAVFREKAHISPNGNIIAANDFKIHLDSIKKGAFNTTEAVKRAKAEAYDAKGKDVTNLISVEGIDAVQREGDFQLTFRYDDAFVEVTVTVTNEIPVVTGKTAYTLTFEGVPNGAAEYKVYSKAGAVVAGAAIEETANGIYRITGLEKGTEYKIDGDVLGSTTGKTTLVDAEDIAKQFEDKQGDTTTNGKKGKDEKAENPNVKVVVDDDGNYKVIVKKDINHSVEIPDTWGDVKVDLGGNSINGNDADAANSAKPGLIFKKDGGSEHPGTSLEIVNGTIKGGNGSTAHPNGAAGVSTGKAPAPAKAEITVGKDGVIKGGNGAAGTDGKGNQNAGNGGNGGAGIEGEITPTVDGGTVSGGSGGAGGSADSTKPGAGGNGGAGIDTEDKKVTILEGTVKGGDAGAGGNATGDNTNAGGNGGNGGNGIDSGRSDIVIGPGKTDVHGGAGGNGGNSNKGNGGNGGSGGSGAEAGKIDNDGGTIAGGNGGTGGNSNNGGHNGNGGNGGSGTKGNHTPTNGGTSSDGNKGQNGKIYVEVLFEKRNGNSLNAGKPVKIVLNEKINQATFDKMQQEADRSKKENEVFFAWVDKNDDTKAYTTETEVTSSVTLVPVYRADSNVVPGQDGNTIAADNFSIRIEKVSSLTKTEAKKLANVKAYDKKGADITNTVTVDQDKLSALQQSTAGIYPDALTFEIPGSVKVSVTVEITDDSPVITGKTAHTLTFKGRANETYEYQELDAQGTPTGNVLTILTDGDGKATITGLKKATPYQISHKKYGSVNGKTALVDAKDIAKQFEDRGAGDTKGNNATDRTEKAENSNVQVVVDDDGNYKVIVKKDIDHTVEIPDTWGEVKIDLGRHTITGDKADDNNAAKPGLDFVKDGSTKEHPGTKLEIVNGTIKGGDGSAKHPDGAPGIGAAGNAADAGLIIGNDAKVIGGNGANGTEGKDGGNGGAGIDGNGKITPTVNGTVTGGNGGKGGDSATGIPGNGGNGGNGISAGDKTITINPSGTVKGGDAGSGGNATGDNTNPGGNGGNGGTGTETTQPGKTDNNGGTTSGGNGGDGGTSNNGNGGNGGDGGSGSTGENNNNGGTSSGGNGGNGGDSNNGTGGNGGNGGSSGETGGNGGNNSGGNGGNGGDSNSGNGGSGGNGGDSNSGTGGNGGNGGDSNNGTGGNGGNGGGSNNGTGGNGGNGGNSNNGNGGNGGDSNSGNNGNGGSSGSNGNRPGGNGGGSNNGNGGNGGNNGGGNSGNNGGDNSGNNGGDNGGNNGGDNSNNNSGSTGNTGNTPDAGNTAGNDSGNNAHKGNKGNSTGNSNAGQKDPAEDDSLNDAADESSLTGDADGSDADGSDADGIQEEESIHADSDSVENGTDSDSHIPFGECGFHWIPIVWLLVILGYTVVRVKKLRDESEEA